MTTRTIAVVSAGLSNPSSTRLLADRLAAAGVAALRARGEDATVEVVELREHARALADHLTTGFAGAELQAAIDTVVGADAVIAVTPVFSASYSGLFKTFFDVLDKDSLIGTPVLLGATAGTPRHSLVVEFALRPLFAYLRAVPVPTGVFAASEDWAGGGATALVDRIDRAAAELAGLLLGRPAASRPVDPFADPTTSFEELLRALTPQGRIGGMPAPAWFTAALAQAPERRDVVVAGARVAYRSWGPAGAPGVLLVHGGAAHSGWWDHIAPLLAGHRVVALDLTGHGDSDRRPGYDPYVWAREVVAVAAAAGLHRPVVVGHSMGGWVSVTVGVEHAAAVSAVVVIDSPLRDEPPDEERLRERRRPHRVYPARDQALARFRTLPEQDVVLPYVREHVAHGSLRAVEGGWTWKFDPDFFGTRLRLRDLLPGVRVPVTLVRCEHGLVPAPMAEEMTGLVSRPMPVVELPGSGHHPMLDQPLALVAALRTLLAAWPPAGAPADR